MAYLCAVGWRAVVGLQTNSGVVRPGVAEFLHSGKDVGKTKYSHQVTIRTFFFLMKGAYDKAMEKREEKIEFESWCEETKLKNLLFRYWYIAYHMELTLLLLLKFKEERTLKNTSLPWKKFGSGCLLLIIPITNDGSLFTCII